MMKWNMMMTGKTKCELLKEIRRKICELNGLENSETDCPYADECCAAQTPELKEISPGHWAACHHLDKLN